MNSRQVAQRCLLEWHNGSDFAEDIFSRLQREFGIVGPDRGFARELFYGVLRNLTALDFVIEQMVSHPPALAPRIVLQLGIYQLLFLHTAPHAAVSETVDLIPKPQRGFINGVLRALTRDSSNIEKNLAAQRADIRLSHPDFLLENWRAEYGEDAAIKIAEWNNTPAEVYLRRNTLRPVSDLPELQPTAHPLLYRVTGSLPNELAAGEFYAQDASTLLAPELLAPQQGETILDACAAPGGKTSYLAAMMQNTGSITATDAGAFRIPRLQENLTRLGVTNTTIVQHDWEQPSQTEKLFDAILADVPCSNTGVMRRRIDVRWRLQPDDFDISAARQLTILENLWQHLRPGGRLVYSTCSLEKSENEDVVANFLSRTPEMLLTKTVERLPFRDDCDGSFSALMVRQ